MSEPAGRRASRLLRWYPKAWRSRYGEEFADLLIADVGERPRSWTRTVDVARGGIVARFAAAGLCGCTLEASDQVRASLASFGCCAAVFLTGCGAWIVGGAPDRGTCSTPERSTWPGRS